MLFNSVGLYEVNVRVILVGKLSKCEVGCLFYFCFLW